MDISRKQLGEALSYWAEWGGAFTTEEDEAHWGTLLEAGQRMLDLIGISDEQAEDGGIWFEAATAPEAYLQQELRRLSAVIEGARWQR